MKYVQIARDYYWFYGIICVKLLSPLAIAEWIEIPSAFFPSLTFVSPLAIAEWIEIPVPPLPLATPRSSPLAIAEWIEILDNLHDRSARPVSASDSGVD